MAGSPVKAAAYRVFGEHREEIFEDLVRGMSIQKLADRYKVSSRILHQWLIRADNEAEYRAALVLKSHNLAAEVLELSDEEPRINPATGAVDTGDVTLRKLRADNRKWVAAKLNPAAYGDKSLVEHSGTVTVASKFMAALKGQRLGNVIEGEVITPTLADMVEPDEVEQSDG